MYIGRQPIVNLQRRVYGYELLFRSPESPVHDGVFASANVVARTFLDLSAGDVLGPHRGFINIDARFLMSEWIECIPSERVVLELLESIEFTPEIVDRCRSLKAAGYMLAADDYRGVRAHLAPVERLLDIVKLDLPELSAAQLRDVAREFPGKTLLAEKVETADQLDRCTRAGCTLFQGYFFAKPEAAGDAAKDPVRSAALALVTAVADDARIEDEIERHPSLAAGLLRLLNSAAAGLSKPIASSREALPAIGRDELRRWLLMLVYLGSSGEPGDEPLLQLAAVRAKAMELLASHMGCAGRRAFVIGLLSLFDAALGMSRPEIVQRLRLDDEIRDALIDYAGDLGALLHLVEAMEHSDDETVRRMLQLLPQIDPEYLLEASRAAGQWATSLGAQAVVNPDRSEPAQAS